jgi:inorganic triphosphatase YgiF
VLQLCKALDELLAQWERSKGTLSMQDSFHARHIAISYLPDMLNTYLSIPARFATTKVLDNGKTAVETFQYTLAELETQVRQLGDDLAAQDAHAFLVHSRFLNQKFAPQGLEAPALNLPTKESKS